MSTYLAGVSASPQAGGTNASQRLDQRPPRPGEVRPAARASPGPPRGVVVDISEEARQAARERAMALPSFDAGQREEEAEPATGPAPILGPADTDLSLEDRQELARLQQQDITVRTRDMAYVAATAGVSGGFTVRYETGPDGRRYAVEANVQLDTSDAATPEQSLAKARALRAALMSAGGDATRDASATARAAALEYRARAEIARAHRDLEQARDAGPSPGLPEVELQGGVASGEEDVG